MTTKELVKATGVTPRMLQYWDERGYLRPANGVQGHARQYSAAQVDVIRRIVVLRRAGVSGPRTLELAQKITLSPLALGAVVREALNLGFRLS